MPQTLPFTPSPSRYESISSVQTAQAVEEGCDFQRDDSADEHYDEDEPLRAVLNHLRTVNSVAVVEFRNRKLSPLREWIWAAISAVKQRGTVDPDRVRERMRDYGAPKEAFVLLDQLRRVTRDEVVDSVQRRDAEQDKVVVARPKTAVAVVERAVAPAPRQPQPPRVAKRRDYTSCTSHKWIDAVLLDSRMNAEQKALAIGIAAFANDETGKAYPSLGAIARFSGMPRTKAFRLLPQLEALGVVQVERGGNGVPNRYEMLLSEPNWRGW